MLVIITGDDASGSREILAGLAREAQLGGKLVYCNEVCDFTFDDCVVLSTGKIGSRYNEFSDGAVDACLVLDDAFGLFDSRNAMSASNRIFSYLAARNRKLNLDILIRVSVMSMLDNRVKRSADVIMDCRPGSKSDFSVVSVTDVRVENTGCFLVDLRELVPLRKACFLTDRVIASEPITSFLEKYSWEVV